ncbi:MAG: 3-methyl-2-oxobutanoate dehydrogenase subunit VorB [Lentisphaerae bacterium GWF2_45_14]|nr:MAG: 3-methyl-2-oxobutanoate dehydrogenase subunit VorB [Lentisphaerae bacterium GWF2_45_14]
MEYSNRLLLKGNEAAVYGALLAGCDCFFGYPITPASEIAHSASLLFPRLGRVFLQAECEIASINMVFGAAAAGRRAMTASSGLGISLKQEGVSYMATCELPCVIVDIMRGGPGLGNIGPEQSDYNQVVKGGGHGNYRCIVLAPNSAQEMCDFTVKGFELADKYRTPVYVLADGVIGQMLESVTLPEPVKKPDIPEWALDGSARSRRNFLTSIYLEHDDLEALNQKLQSKYDSIKKAEQTCEKYFLDDAEIVLVAYGIASRVARTAVKKLRDKGIKAGLLRPITLFPFPNDELMKTLGTAKTYLSVEMSNGQMIDDIKLGISCRKPVELCSRMGGNIPSVDEIMDKTIETLEAAK